MYDVGEVAFFAARFGSLFVVGDGFHRFCAADYQLCQD